MQEKPKPPIGRLLREGEPLGYRCPHCFKPNRFWQKTIDLGNGNKEHLICHLASRIVRIEERLLINFIF